MLKKGGRAFGVRVIGAVAAFGVNIYLARLLGADGFGLFSLSITVISILAVFNKFGLDSIALREIAKDRDAASNGHARAVFSPIARLILPSSIILSVIIILFSPWISEVAFNKPQLSSVLSSMAPILVYLTFGYLLCEGMKAIHHTEAGIFFQTTLLPIGFISIAFCFQQDYVEEPGNAALIYSITALLVLTLSNHHWRKITSAFKVGIDSSWKSILRKGFPLLLISSGGLLMAWTDVIILGIFESEASIGIYTAASKVALVTSLLLVSINAIVAPKFSHLYSTGKLDILEKLAKQTTRLVTFLIIVPTAIFLVYPETILSIFGPGFVKGDNVLMILTLGQFVNVACGSVGYMLVMTNNEFTMRNIILGAALVNVALSLVLVATMGMVGVAISTAVSIALWNILALLFVRKYMGFWMIG